MSRFTDEDFEPVVETVPGREQPVRIYGGSALPPGAVAVPHRTLARYVQPGTVAEPHGVPPIGDVTLPEGWVVQELYLEDDAWIRVLPFRFPFYSKAYALKCGERFLPVFRNIQPGELNAGVQVVVQLNDSGDWAAFFGIVVKNTSMTLRIRMPDGAERNVNGEHVQFVGRVMAWWDDTLPTLSREIAAELSDGYSVYEP